MQTLREAYDHFLETSRRVQRDGDWHRLGDLFTPDAVYRRPGVPDQVGREAIRRQLVLEATTLPGALMQHHEVLWDSLDEKAGRVAQELRHVARDPGDGSVHAALSTSMLSHAGDGRWSRLSVVHSPEAYRAMYRSWIRAAAACGNTDGAEEMVRALRDHQAHQSGSTSSEASWPTDDSSSRTTR